MSADAWTVGRLEIWNLRRQRNLADDNDVLRAVEQREHLQLNNQFPFPRDDAANHAVRNRHVALPDREFTSIRASDPPSDIIALTQQRWQYVT